MFGYYVARHVRQDIFVHVYRETTNPDKSKTFWASVVRGNQPTLFAGDNICLRLDEILHEATSADFDRFRVQEPYTFNS